MQPAASALPQSIGVSELAPVVRRATRRDALDIAGWRLTQLGGGIGNPVSVGLYRFEGAGSDGAEQIDWRLVLKVIQSPANAGWTDMGEGDDQTHWNYWRRELLAFQSGLLTDLPDGLAAPECFGVAELPGNFAWIWLEEIKDARAGDWTLDRYALSARHLGRLNGRFLAERPLPAYPWLSADLTRQWTAGFRPVWQSLPWEHPHVRQRYPDAGANAFRSLLLEAGRFQSELDRLPRTLYHGDTYPTNFMSRTLADGAEQTVALDWALMGIGPLCADLAQFALGVENNLPDTGSKLITETLLESYLDGLRDTGWRGNPRLARFGFTAQAALRVGLFQVYVLSEELKQTAADAAAGDVHAGAPDCFEVRMAKEAYKLLEAIQ